jgi:hypothetical protein
MSRLEQELKVLLGREEPPPGFAGRVLARAAEQRRRRVSYWVAAAAAALTLIAGGAEYRRYQGEQARDRVLLAVRIAGSKLHKVQQKISAPEPVEHPAARVE